MGIRNAIVIWAASAFLYSGCVEIEKGNDSFATASAGSSSAVGPGTAVQALPAATQMIYTHNERYLYSYDPRNNSETLIGRFSPPGGGTMGNMSDIAVSNTGILIGISCFGVIYQINPSNAELTLLMQYPGGGNSLTFLSNGTLIAAGGSRITTVNLANHTIAPFIQDQTFESSGDIAALPDGYLYETVVNGTSDALVKINPSTGHTVAVGSVGFKDVGGLAYAYGKLYGFTLSGAILEIDAGTGRGTAIGATSLDHFGAAASPVAW